MAVAPPLDLVVQKAPILLSKLESQLFKVSKKLSEKVAEASEKSNKIPKGVSCSDPRVVNVKRIFEQIQTIVQKLADILRVINIVYIVCIAVANAARAYVAFRLTILTPTVPADIEILEAQKQLIGNIITALKKIGIVIAVVNGAVQTALATLAGAINFISSICQDEIFAVFSATQNSIDLTSIANIDMSRFDVPPSKFYQPVNVSEDDIKSRADAVDILLKQQRSLLDLLEAPSRVIVLNGQSVPANTVGKAGDFAINNDTNTIYGPKPSDTEWNEGIKY